MAQPAPKLDAALARLLDESLRIADDAQAALATSAEELAEAAELETWTPAPPTPATVAA